ncbi:MAG: SRPBCC domain-containing protein [Thermoanaerobaculia bacterium]
MTEAIERTLELDAAPDDVWRALTDPTELSGWFGDTAELSPTLGGEGWFGWEAHGKYSMRVEVFDPPKRLAWRWAREPDTPLDETASTLVEWTLTPRPDGGTTLTLRESGFVREEDRQANVKGWKKELEELQAFLSAA